MRGGKIDWRGSLVSFSVVVAFIVATLVGPTLVPKLGHVGAEDLQKDRQHNGCQTVGATYRPTQSDREEKGKGDAAVCGVEDSDSYILQFSDGFGSVAHKCDGFGHRVYVERHKDGDVESRPSPVVIDDPTCGKGGQ